MTAPVPDNLTRTRIRNDLEKLVTTGIDWHDHAEPDRFPSTGAPRPAAVLVLFGALDDVDSQHMAPRVPRDLDVLFVERAATLTDHPGQIAFPGGRIDATDTGPVAAALREAAEETGLDPSGVDVIGTLLSLPLPVSRHEVTPVVGWWARSSHVRVVDPGESAHVFRAPVADLIDPANRRTTTVTRGDYTMRSPGFLVGDRLIWGFTGIVLAAILDELGWAQPWDRTRELQIPI